MNFIPALIISLIFLVLSLIHFNWALGSKWGITKAIPTDNTGKKVMHPDAKASTVVGLGLLFFSFYYAAHFIHLDLPGLTSYIGWGISAIFIARSIGDFKYVGLFKKIKGTEFSEMDTKLYVPLCLIIGLIGILLEIKNS